MRREVVYREKEGGNLKGSGKRVRGGRGPGGKAVEQEGTGILETAEGVKGCIGG